MESLHWLILIPYYFFAALSALLMMIVLSRLLRLRVRASTLVTTAIVLMAGAVIAPLLTGWATIDDYSGRWMLVLGLVSFGMAGLDTLLAPHLSLPLDKELQQI